MAEKVWKPILVDGVTGPVTVTTNVFGGDVRLFVHGRPVPQEVVIVPEFRLPLAAGGTAAARVHLGPADPCPSIEVGGRRYRSEPRPSVLLRVLALLPLVLALGGLVGVLLGVLALVANVALVRAQLPPQGRIFAIAGVDGTATVLFVVLYRVLT